MLKRIFVVTLSVAVLCTFALAAVSPAVRTFVESWNAQVSIGILDSVRALYVLIPLLVAILFRVFFLHDKISDLFRLRRRFDLENILRPLAEGIGFPTAGPKWERIEQDRDLAMTRTFYRYASFRDPQIDLQLVRTAADRWAWFWCTVEPLVILLITGLIFAMLAAWFQLFVVLVFMAVLIATGFLLWPQLRTGARNQVAEILNNKTWKEEIRSALDNLTGNAATAAQQGDAPDGAPRRR
jgi:hypothetical protein